MTCRAGIVYIKGISFSTSSLTGSENWCPSQEVDLVFLCECLGAVAGGPARADRLTVPLSQAKRLANVWPRESLGAQSGNLTASRLYAASPASGRGSLCTCIPNDSSPDTFPLSSLRSNSVTRPPRRENHLPCSESMFSICSSMKRSHSLAP